MINSYDIKIIDGKEVLYLYFNFNFEFASFNFNKKKRKIKDIIIDNLTKSNIVFKGITVLLIAGGIVFGQINLTDKDLKYINNNKVISILDKVENKPNNVINIDENYDVILENNNLEESLIDTNRIEPTIEETKTTNDILEKQENTNFQNNVQPEIQVNNNTYVNVLRSNGESLYLELEDYIMGVVAAEMPASFHVEALKAQAIIARTYALKAIQNGKILTDNESTQSYKDNQELLNIWGSSYNNYLNKIKEAVNSTKGMYLTYNGDYIEALYHSTSNGYTEDSVYVWGNYYPYLVSVESIYDNLNPSFEVKKEISYVELSNKLGINITSNSVFNLDDKTSSGRINNILIDNISFKGTVFRNKLGLRSTSFDIAKNDQGIIVTTLGYGHGVGLSQYGANGYAKNGYTFNQILIHYYPGVTICV